MHLRLAPPRCCSLAALLPPRGRLYRNCALSSATDAALHPPPPAAADEAGSSGAEAAASPPERSSLDAVVFVLCDPQGPANVGGAARALQNFGLASLRVVCPGPFVRASPAADGDAPDPSSPAASAFSQEALEYAVSARWVLDAATEHASPAAACSDATLVLATTARPRDRSIPVLSAREAAAAAASEVARGGKVAFLFGSERTGLSNAALACAHAAVCIPTAAFAQDGAQQRSGAGGRFSLNLATAVGIVAYEVFAARGIAPQAPPPVSYLDTAARGRLVAELFDALSCLTVLRTAPLPAATLSPGGAAALDAPPERPRLDRGADGEAELRALTRALGGSPIATRDAAPLFTLARRVLALARLAKALPSPPPHRLPGAAAIAARASEGPLDVPMRSVAASLVSHNALAVGTPRSREAREKAVRAVREHARDAIRLSLTKAEAERLVDEIAAAGPPARPGTGAGREPR